MRTETRTESNIGICRCFTLSLAAMLVFSVSNILAGVCLKDTRPMQLGGTPFDNWNTVATDAASAVRLRHYLCETDNGDQVSIQFNRLTDLAASLLMKGSMPGGLRKVFTNARIVSNDVLAEFAYLLNEFGTDDSDYTIFRAVSVTGEAASVSMDDQYGRVLVKNQSDNHRYSFPDPNAVIVLENENRVPQGYNNAGNWMIWRYLTRNDLAEFRQKMIDWNTLIATQNKRYWRYDPDNNWTEPMIRLFRYLAKSGWPEDFIVLVGAPPSDGCGSPHWEFYYYPRQLLFDVAVVENVSLHAIDINALMGRSSHNKALRPQSSSKALLEGRQTAIAGGLRQLSPGEKLIVPMRIIFAIPDALRKTFDGEPFSVPTMINYVWGPEHAVTGIKVNGDIVSLEASAANFLALTTSSERGSCPYLYTWDEGRWNNQGKIIHEADGPNKEMTESRQFDGLVSRFRIIEQEAELAYINTASLRLELANGSSRHILLKDGALSRKDSEYDELFYGDMIDLTYSLPDDIQPRQVVSSILEITGYYRRYGDILSERRAPANASPILRTLGEKESSPLLDRRRGQLMMECKAPKASNFLVN